MLPLLQQETGLHWELLLATIFSKRYNKYYQVPVTHLIPGSQCFPAIQFQLVAQSTSSFSLMINGVTLLTVMARSGRLVGSTILELLLWHP